MRGNRHSAVVGLFFAAIVGGSAAFGVSAFPPDWPTVNGSAVEPSHFQFMKEHGFLPLQTTFLSDEEVAQKLDLSRPELTPIKEALQKKDAAALKVELIAYL